MITIIDYGLGNIHAFTNVYKRLNIETRVACKKNDLKEATKLILPGVGAFDHAMIMLNKSGMRETLNELVLVKRIPIIGVCVGMQILGKYSDEGTLPGLGWIDGIVKKFDASMIIFKTHLPHMGWNNIKTNGSNPLFYNLNSTARFYFLHSYYFQCVNQSEVISTTDYGITYASAINSNNIFGVQFHPEKSHSNGIQVLNNYSRL